MLQPIMSSEQLEEFWSTLCNLDGLDAQKDIETLNQKLSYPKFLYRYRPVNYNSLEALGKNRIYFSTANYYDDPFDTFLQIDFDGLLEFINNAIESDNLEQSKNIVAEIVSRLFLINVEQSIVENVTKEIIKSLGDMQTVSKLISFFRNIRNELKKEIWSVCFSEEVFNENLWLKYADQHRGFVICYDLENEANFLCGKQEKCEKCGIKLYGTPLYPIYYSNEKYNATKFAQYIAMREILQQINDDDQREFLEKQICAMMGNLTWESLKITLIKKECHHYDKEWRMIVPVCMNPPVMREWIPDSIILGLKMEEVKRYLVIETAKNAGIKKIYQSYINNQGDLDAFLLTDV